jgi:predicted TPR repeat methyltransferase
VSDKSSLSLSEVQQLHRDGRLDEAKSAYLRLLDVDNQNVEALHYLGILYAEEGDLENAEHFLVKAIELNPHDLSLCLHLANVYKARKNYDKAVHILQQVIQSNPKFAAAYNNLGTVYDAQMQWDAAIQSYYTAIDSQPNYVDAYYNLGLALIKAKRFSEAMNTYQSLLELAPEHLGSRFQLGRLFMQQNKYQEAIDQLSIIENEHPLHFETQSNLATSFLKLGWLSQAKTHYLKALNVKPEDVQVLFNLGVIATRTGSIADAIEFYTRALNQDANIYEAHNNVGVAFLSVKNREKALQHFREALRIQPDNKSLQHTINILTHDKNLSSSPPEYIRSLFNSYADHYDAHITQALKYDVPKQLFAAVNHYADVKKAHWNILDLGCGTGLCGELFQGKNNTLTGVDIAEQMLEIVAQKNLYQGLIHADIPDFLKDKHDVYDLVIAGDVLVYFGDLGELFADIYQALHHDGLFVFNAEIGSDKDYSMTESGRFAHSKSYLDNLIQQTQFKTLDYQIIHLRTQNGVPVEGHLYLLAKLK